MKPSVFISAVVSLVFFGALLWAIFTLTTHTIVALTAFFLILYAIYRVSTDTIESGDISE